MPELLHQFVTDQADRRPETQAVLGEGTSLSYAQLEELSNQLARTLREGGCRKGDRVCLLMPKSPMAIAAILGIYKAGGIYVPLDPASPPGRQALMLDSCENTWVLAGGPVAGLLDEVLAQDRFLGLIRVGWIAHERPDGTHFKPEFTLEEVQRLSTASVDAQTTRDDPAHILFTSGSTGIPKGVIITHSNVIHFIEWAMQYFRLGPSDRMSGHTPLHFDLSFFDIFGTFAAGAQLHLVPPELNLLPHRLVAFIRRAELTQFFSVPSVLNYMAKFDAVRPGDFPALQRLLWCGEVFPTPALIYWMQRLPHVQFTNLYGPTETTIASSVYTVPRCPTDEKAPIPIGSACDGEELLVLDDQLRPLPPNTAGDLYIRGVGLSPGYWKDLEKTRRAFLPNPHSPDQTDRIYKTGDLAKIGEDGLVYFLGRADSQIKSRGYRIELGEIEAALNAVDAIQECAVVAIETEGFDRMVICCAYVPAPGREVTPVALREELSKALPGYMIPVRWMTLERLPHNGNVKIDRRKLKEEFRAHEAQTHR